MGVRAVLAAVAGTAVLAGCGDRAAPVATDPDAAERAFARCLREHGVNERVARMCRDRTGAGRVLDPAERAELHDKLLAYARCMRARGVRIPDPEMDDRGGGLVLRRRGAGNPGIDPRSPAFRRADAGCHDRLPQPSPSS